MRLELDDIAEGSAPRITATFEVFYTEAWGEVYRAVAVAKRTPTWHGRPWTRLWRAFDEDGHLRVGELGE